MLTDYFEELKLIFSNCLHILGILLGVAVRTKKPLAIPLAPLVWKLLVHEPVSMDDLEETDLLYAQCLRGIRDIHLNDVNQQNFHEVSCLTDGK